MLSFAFAPNNQLGSRGQLAGSLASQAKSMVLDKPILQPSQPDAFTPSVSSIRAGTDLAFVEKKLAEWATAPSNSVRSRIQNELERTKISLKNENEVERLDELLNELGRQVNSGELLGSKDKIKQRFEELDQIILSKKIPLTESD